MQRETIAAQGGIVHYWIDRKENTADCIVFTHGVTADHTMFEKQVSYFSDNYTIILWDVPMHGLSRPYHGLGFIALGTTPFGCGYYAKSDLWWLRQIVPIAKCFPANILRISMAWSVSRRKYSYQKMMAMLKPVSKAEIIEQMRVAYEYFPMENKDVDFRFPVLILVGEKDSTGKVKSYCREWAKQTGYPLYLIKGAKHFSNGDNPEQVNKEIEDFIHTVIHQERK